VEDAAGEHNRLFLEAVAVVKNEIPTSQQPHLSKPGWFLARKLNRAIDLFKRSLQLNPQNWNAMWFIGKVQQRLRNWDEARVYLERAFQSNPTQPDSAREASICAMELGQTDEAIRLAQSALGLDPTNAGLGANLALAYLLADRLGDARAAIDNASTCDNVDPISETVRAMIQHFAAHSRVPPNSTGSLVTYWHRHLRSLRKSSVL